MLLPIVNGKLDFSANNGDDAATDLFVLDASVTPLPIKMGDLTVKLVSQNVKLEWFTLQEINSKEFIVQRSQNRQTFTNIGTVAAAGQSNSRRTYGFTDEGVTTNAASTVYYRLIAVDKDEKSTTSKIVSIKIGDGRNGM